MFLEIYHVCPLSVWYIERAKFGDFSAEVLATMNQPLFPDIGICALVPDEWDGPWQPRHYILSGLARYFQVVWVNPASDWLGMLRFSNNQNVNGAASIEPPGFVAYKPAWLPRLYRPKWLSQYTFNARLKHVRRMLASRGCKKIILYIWRPEFGGALDLVPFDLSCYHNDDEYSFSQAEVEVDPMEKALIARVDQVFIHSPGLIERKGAINPHTAFSPNGVDFKAYSTMVPQRLMTAYGPFLSP